MIESIPWTGLAQFGILVSLLFLVSALGLLWERVAWATIGVGVRGAVRLGVYDPDKRAAERASVRKDRSFLKFSKLLRTTSEVIPGEPPHNTRTIILPMLLVAVPLWILFVVGLIFVPLILFFYLLISVPGVLSLPLALLGLAGYFWLFVVAGSLSKRLARMDSRAQGTA